MLKQVILLSIKKSLLKLCFWPGKKYYVFLESGFHTDENSFMALTLLLQVSYEYDSSKTLHNYR